MLRNYLKPMTAKAKCSVSRLAKVADSNVSLFFFKWPYEGKPMVKKPFSRPSFWGGWGTLGGLGRLGMSFFSLILCRGGRKEAKFDEWIPPMNVGLIGRITVIGFRQYLKDYNYTIMITLW